MSCCLNKCYPYICISNFFKKKSKYRGKMMQLEMPINCEELATPPNSPTDSSMISNNSLLITNNTMIDQSIYDEL